MPNFLVHVDQRFPTGGSRNSGVRNKIFRGPKCDFRGWELVCSWKYFSSNETKFRKSCMSYYWKEHYPA